MIRYNMPSIVYNYDVLLFLSIVGVVCACLVENYYNILQNVDSNLSIYNTGACKWVMTFAADVPVISIGLLIFLTGVEPTEAESIYRFIFVPHLMMIGLVLSLLQTPETRGGLWRRVVESRIITVIGYCSFPIYLLQQVLLNFYARIIYDDLRTGSFPLIRGGTDPEKYNIYGDNTWFGDKPWWWKLIGVICLVAFCWPIQKYYQDTLVASLAMKFINWIRQKRELISEAKIFSRMYPYHPLSSRDLDVSSRRNSQQQDGSPRSNARKYGTFAPPPAPRSSPKRSVEI